MIRRPAERIPTGISGIDAILRGGLPKGQMFLIDGAPGVGKTTLALQFLLEGVRRKERALYVTLSETRSELDAVAYSHGWSLDGIDVMELSEIESHFSMRTQNTLFQSSEVELSSLSNLLVERFDAIAPVRMVLDSLSEVRLMAQNPLRYRRQVLAFKQHFAASGCTVLLLDDRSGQGQDVQVQSIVHGMITLQTVPLKFGINRRFLTVPKMRGAGFREGNHDYVIKPGGLIVYPRLVAAEKTSAFEREVFKSGNPELDSLMGGGIDAGTGTLFMGPAGSGKSTVASMFAAHAAGNGRRVLYFAFDEVSSILMRRAQEIGLDFEGAMRSGRLEIRQVDPAEIAPGELADEIQRAVSADGVRMVILDSLNGYVNAMPQEEFLHLHLHELLTYLNQNGVATIMVLAQSGLVGPMGSPVDVSYLADSILLTRFFEARGAMRKALSLVKKRSGAHEDTIREIRLTPRGITIGPPLVDFQGVMTGVPRFLGGSQGPRDEIEAP
jgi:circadian clock protein KaiC